MGKDWREAREGILRLPEGDAVAFQLFAGFVYTGKVEFEEDRTDEDIATNNWPGIARMHLGWLLGDALLSTTFKDAVTDSLVEWVLATNIHPTELHLEIYGYSDAPSGMKRLLVDLAVFRWQLPQLATRLSNEKPSTFLADASLRAIMAIRTRDLDEAPWIDASCKYHDHGEERPCYKTMF